MIINRSKVQIINIISNELMANMLDLENLTFLMFSNPSNQILFQKLPVSYQSYVKANPIFSPVGANYFIWASI